MVTRSNAENAFANAVKAVIDELSVTPQQAEVIVSKAVLGGETTKLDSPQWVSDRLVPNCVVIDEPGYAAMCVDALKIVSTTAGTDFGSSRQRDLSQQWADTTRGYLGEYAFRLFLQRHNIEARLGHDQGPIDEYLPMDIHEIRCGGGSWRAPKVKLGVKTTKWNGIWMDIPGKQFDQSQIHVLVKVGTGRDHLIAFFKELSVFRDKVLKRGQDVGALSSNEAGNLFTSLPSFRPIPAYICGFVRRDDTYRERDYEGKMGRIRYTIQKWRGPISTADRQRIASEQGVEPSKIVFESIVKFSHDSGYLFNTGNLCWRRDEWDEVIRAL